MNKVIFAVFVVSFCATNLQGLQSAVIPLEEPFPEVKKSLNASETLEALVDFLVTNGVPTEKEINERQGKALLGPGKWCDLPQTLVNALQGVPRSARFLRLFNCVPPQWKIQWNVSKGIWTTTTTTTPCPSLLPDGSCQVGP